MKKILIVFIILVNFIFSNNLYSEIPSNDELSEKEAKELELLIDELSARQGHNFANSDDQVSTNLDDISRDLKIGKYSEEKVKAVQKSIQDTKEIREMKARATKDFITSSNTLRTFDSLSDEEKNNSPEYQAAVQKRDKALVDRNNLEKGIFPTTSKPVVNKPVEDSSEIKKQLTKDIISSSNTLRTFDSLSEEEKNASPEYQAALKKRDNALAERDKIENSTNATSIGGNNTAGTTNTSGNTATSLKNEEFANTQGSYASNLTDAQKAEVNALSQEKYGKDTFDADGNLIEDGVGNDGLGGPVTDLMKNLADKNSVSGGETPSGTSNSPTSGGIKGKGGGAPLVNCTGLPGCVDKDPMNPSAPSISNNLGLEIITSVIGQIIQFVAVIAVIALIISGIMYLISGGEEEKAKRAKTWIKWALVGVILSISAWGIINMLNKFTIG